MSEQTSIPHRSTTAVSKSPGMHLRLTQRPDTFAERFANSAAVWLLLMAYWVFTHVLIAIFPVGGWPYPPASG